MDAMTDTAAGGPVNQRDRSRKSRSVKARERLAASGVAIDDVERPKEGRRRKPPTVVITGLRDGPGMPLRQPGHEEAARHVAGGMPERDAWRMAGYSTNSANNRIYLSVMNTPAFQERVAELRDQYRLRSGIPLAYVQERLLRLTASDIGDFIERVPHSTRWRAKDFLSLPPEVRACVSEVTIDNKTGNLNFKLHDKSKALAELARMVAPTKVEMSGPNGGPMQLDAMLDGENLAKLDDDEVVALKQIAAKLVAAGPVVDAEVEADDGEGET